jgi:MFS family permease
MTSGPRIVVPPRPAARSTRSIESDQAAKASGLHETAAPGAVSAGFEPWPQGSREGRQGVRRLVRTQRFWAFFGGAVAIGLFDEGIIQAFIPHAVQAGFGVEFASFALGAQSLAYVVGQVAGGGLSDRYGRRIVGIAAAALVAGGIVAAFGAASSLPGLVVAGIVAHGIGTGATIAVRSATFSDVFGGPSFGTIFGLLAVAYPVGGAIAVYVGALSSDAFRSYGPLVVLAVIGTALWGAVLWIAGPRRRRARASRAVPAEALARVDSH